MKDLRDRLRIDSDIIGGNASGNRNMSLVILAPGFDSRVVQPVGDVVKQCLAKDPLLAELLEQWAEKVPHCAEETECDRERRGQL
jgi:hypothetical protein